MPLYDQHFETVSAADGKLHERHTLTYKDGEVVVLDYKEWPYMNSTTHGYWVQSPSKYAGRKYGVTTCQSVLDKPGLIQWAANMATESIREKCASHKAGWYVTEEDLQNARYSHKEYKDDRASVGTRVHDWYKAHINGDDYPIDDAMKLGVQNILKYEEQYNPEYIFSERVMFSKKHDFAGKCDTGVIIDGQYGIVDLKTGKPDEEWIQKTVKGKRRYIPTGKWRARGEHLSQNAGYDIGFEELDGRKAEFYGVLYVDCIDGRMWFFKNYNTKFFRKDYITTLKKYKQIRERDNRVNLYV